MRQLILFIVVLFTINVQASRLDSIAKVLKYVETGNNPNAIGDGGDSYGVLQIQKACVLDVNKYYGTKYKHEDMFRVECAVEVFKLYAQMGIDRYVKRHGIEPTEEVIVRNHNGGIYRGHRIEATKEYYDRYKKWKKLIKSNLKN